MGRRSIVVLEICLSLLAAGLLCRTAFAQVPESGRWQDLDFSEQEMNSVSDARYHEMLRDLAHEHRLDDDRTQLRRIHRITADLVQAAIVEARIGRDRDGRVGRLKMRKLNIQESG